MKKIRRARSLLIVLLFILNISSIYSEEDDTVHFKNEENINRSGEIGEEVIVNEHLNVITSDKAIRAEKKRKKELLKESKKKEKALKKVKAAEVVEGVGIFLYSNIKKEVGNARVAVNRKLGSYQLYTTDTRGTWHPLFTNHNSGTQSFFALRVGNDCYDLRRNKKVNIGTRDAEDGVKIAFGLAQIARLVVSIDFIKIGDIVKKSIEEMEPIHQTTQDINTVIYKDKGDKKYKIPDNAEIIKVSLMVENRGKKTNIFSCKSVMDTYLGEHTKKHFRTAIDNRINREMQFSAWDDARWIYSGNDRIGLKIFIGKEDTQGLESATLSSHGNLSLSQWKATINTGRTFDTALSYNDSAVGLNFQDKRLAPFERAYFYYYIMPYAVDNDEVIADIPLSELLKKEEVKVEEEKREEVKKEESVKEEVPKKEKKEVLTYDNTTMVFDEKSITEDKINYAYVQKLLDRINYLEEHNEAIDGEEMDNLNKELDAILNKLNKR